MGEEIHNDCSLDLKNGIVGTTWMLKDNSSYIWNLVDELEDIEQEASKVLIDKVTNS